MDPIHRHTDKPNRTVLVGTIVVLLAVFVLVILAFFVISALTPAFVGKCVAVVNIDAPISIEGQPASIFNTGTPGSEEIAGTISELDKRDDVGAVLFVFNSPGGSVVATREIYSAVKGLNKPKVAYFREVAASGAYYIATGTDYIISDPDAVTGSIGVIATFTDMSDLLEKVGVNVTAVTSGPHKDIGSSFREMKPEEQEIMQALINEIYSEFRSVVLENRQGKLDMAKFNEVTDGRILSGRQAAKVGLVDETGSKKDALLRAAELGGIPAPSAEDIRVCEVSTTTETGGLFSLDAILKGLGLQAARQGNPQLEYR